MSENANLRQNLQNVPSIFEIRAAETLDTLIYPALSKIINYLYFRLDFKLFGAYRLSEEVSSVLTLALQYLYLRNRGSSFGESFYGLQRISLESDKLITHRQQVISAGIVTFLPYLERKLKARSAQHDTFIWQRQLLKILNIYHASKAVHTFLYLIKYASSHSSIFRALSLTLRYPIEPPNDRTTYIFLKILEVLAFFLQFIHWWYSNDHRHQMGGSLKNPNPLKSSIDKREKYRKGDCPVCLTKITTPTACSVSGYVYCWKCIISHLKSRMTCPVTGYQITPEDLITIYET
ncbi:PREDICTED: peroxisome assembly protein 12 [Rhagoletis zephyria]|uniref:peroxisome assembly protein 12 n=1 Tax=Rhagoletis zephyria TaxID=28612 RepID=UPI00081171A8|nr:PREDICTED: peroxisome assembly protein 12 [Rhagoletis zephyria]XP_036340830.1 peroxisome assembly protein 12-like [Rhagoletis pomonella]